MKRLKGLVSYIVIALLVFAPVITPAVNTTAIASAATISISNKTVTLEVGKSKTLKISGTSKKVTWSSSKKSVATVSSKGYVTAKAVGTATITATVNGKKYTCKITVKKPIKLSYSSYTLEKGKTKTLSVSGTTSKVTWSSSNKSVVTVSGKGLLTAKAAGTATITATVNGKKLTCKITVKDPIKLSHSSYTLELGKSKTLAVTGTADAVTWTSSNKSVVTVSSKGVITAKAAGSATITATVAGKKLTCVVTVKLPVKLSHSSFTLDQGKTMDLSVSGTNNSITWSSDNEAIASVSSTGTVTAIAAGKATITAIADGKTLTCIVTVNAVNPLVANAPFEAKEFKTGKLNLVIPRDWNLLVDNTNESIYFATVDPTTPLYGSDFSFTLIKTASTPKDYSTSKEMFQTFVSEEMINSYYNSILSPLGIEYSISDYVESDIKIGTKDVFKAEYNVSIMGETIKQAVYYYYIDNYFAEISVTDANGSFLRDAEYILNTIEIK